MKRLTSRARTRTLPLLAIAVPLPFTVYAQEPAQLETVVVSATRSNITTDKSPQTVQVITQEQIEQQLSISTNASDVLSNLIPSYTPSRGKLTGSGETLRGRTPLILIDGVPQSNPIRPTGREVHTIDYSMLERIEVIQGANAVNGLGATGGVINLVTKRPEDGTLNQHIDVQMTMPTERVDGDGLSLRTTYGLNGRQGAWDYLLSLSYDDQGTYRDAKGRLIGVDNTQGDMMDSRSYDVLAKLGYQIDGKQRLQMSVNRYRIKNNADYLSVTGNRQLGIPTTSREGTPPGSAPRNDVWTSSVNYQNTDFAGMELSVMAFNQEFEGLFGATNTATFQDVRFAPLGTLYDQSRSVASKYGSKVTLTKSDLMDRRLKLTGGFDTLFDKGKQDLYGTGRTYVPESKYNNLSLFGQAEFQLTDALTVHGGVRREDAELKVGSYRTLAANNGVLVEGGKIDFKDTVYNAGLVYTPVKGLSLFGSYSEGFGIPDVGRTLRSINQPGQRIDNLSALQPIITESKEVGVRGAQGAFDGSLSYFQSDSDLGARVTSVGGVFLTAREKTRIQGVDASVGFKINPQHKVKLSYVHTRGRYDSDENGSLDAKLDGLNVSPDRVVASWSADWSREVSTYVQVQHAFTRSFDESAKHFSGYTLVDAALRYQLPKGELKFAIANLFNEDYITYYSQSALVEPDRYFAGRGRTLTIGYSLYF
ncbi:TonB-dependent receptor [Pigmentiphaga aceris]|uniref:TonB-dependent receptor n=2 Tax=Pigmentiphaga aceris TaxID=1940612 RepID=A0A5C0B934_9BURK|nr:TonB-dependent receptor [Pigmentiphaga aceris]